MKKLLTFLISILIIGIVLPLMPRQGDIVLAADPQPIELTDNRTASSKKYYLGPDEHGRLRYAIKSRVGRVHYQDELGSWLNINNQIVDNVMDEAGYTFTLLQPTFNNGQIIEFAKEGENVRLQPMALEWTNSIDQTSNIAMPESVPGVTTNTPVQLLPGVDSYQGNVKWDNAYGLNRDFEFITEPTRLTKILTLESPDDLPEPPQFIIDGGEPVLRLNMIFDPSDGVDIFVDDSLWDKQTTVQTFGRVEFRKDSEILWAFAPLYYWDSEQNSGESIKTLRKAGNKLYVEIRVPYSWLQSAVYPVYIDVTIDEVVDAEAEDGWQVESGNTTIADVNNFMYVYSDGIAANRRWVAYITDCAIPQGSTVDTAYGLIFCREPANWDNANLNVHLQDGTANPSDLTVAVGDISDRSRTTASTSIITDNFGAGENQTGSLVDEFQEVVGNYTTERVCVILRPNTDTYKELHLYETALYESGIYVEYTAAGGSAPTVVTGNATSVEETTATLQGNITATGGANATVRGFWYSGSTANESGNFGTGNFTNGVSSLSAGTSYEYYAYATNPNGTGTGANVTFTTKPQAPTSLGETSQESTWVAMGWTLGTGSENTTVRYRTDGTYPTDYNDGTLAYNGTGSSVNITGLAASIRLSVGAWAVNTDNETIYSDDSAQDTAWTRPANPTNLIASNPQYTTVDLDWTMPAGANRTHIRYDTSGYPANVAAGTQAFFSTGNTTTVTSLPADTLIYFNAWVYSDNSTLYSSGNYTATATTLTPSTPTVDTGNATGVGSTSATGQGNITATGGTNATLRGGEWGVSSGNYTANVTEGGSFGTGNFTYAITSLSANTTYYTRALAQHAWGTGYGGEVSFTTTSVAAGLAAPTGFTLTLVGVNDILATWNAVSGANVTYLMMASSNDYPNSPTGDFMITYNGSALRTTIANFTPDLYEYSFSLWSRTNPYSSTYATATIGGDNVESVADEISGFATSVLLVVYFLPVIFFSVMAFWRDNSLMFMLAAGCSIVVGFYWFNSEVSNWGLGVSLMMWAYSIVCLGLAIFCMFKQETEN